MPFVLLKSSFEVCTLERFFLVKGTQTPPPLFHFVLFFQYTSLFLKITNPAMWGVGVGG